MTLALSTASLIKTIVTSSTGTIDDSLLSSSREQDRRHAWERVVDNQLIKWATNSRIPDDETISPSIKAINRAIEVGVLFRDDKQNKVNAPDWVVAAGDGGVSFRWGNPDGMLRTFDFLPDGTIEFIESEKSRIIARIPIA